MNYVLLPSLEHSALARIVITLWTQDDIKALLAQYNFKQLIAARLRFAAAPFSKNTAWQILEKKVRDNIKELQLPETLEKRLMDFVTPLGNEILHWACYQRSFGIFFGDSLKKLCWTPHYTVDVKKTAEILVRDENLSIVNRYKLACTYCLEDYIHFLWEQLNGRQFYGKNLPAIKEQESSLVSFWSYYMKGGLAQFDDILAEQSNAYTSVYHYGFSCAVSVANKVATEYFLQKLTPEEKEQSLVKAALDLARKVTLSFCASFHTGIPEGHYADVFRTLLCYMNEEQQMEVFKNHPQYALQSLLHWPWQDFFIPTAEYILPFLDEGSYSDVINDIHCKIIENAKDYNYRKLFEVLLQKMSASIKNYFMEDCAGILLFKLLKIEDVESVKSLLSCATPSQKEGIMFSHIGKYICENLLYYSCKWNLLMMLIKECLPSKCLIVKFRDCFREDFMKCTISITSQEYRERKKKFQIFTALSENVMVGLDKRKNTKDEEPEKRPCTTHFQG